MRIRHDEDPEIRDLIERGSSSWSGPSPRAGQARWAIAGERGRGAGRVMGLAAAGAGFTLLICGSVLLAAAAVSPAGAASVTRVVSGVFVGSSRATPTAEPSASPIGSPSERPRPASSSPAVPAAVPRATATPPRSDDGHRPSPQPTTPGQPSPSPSPSGRPDD
jgi:hypothetical protein